MVDLLNIIIKNRTRGVCYSRTFVDVLLLQLKKYLLKYFFDDKYNYV